MIVSSLNSLISKKIPSLKVAREKRFVQQMVARQKEIDLLEKQQAKDKAALIAMAKAALEEKCDEDHYYQTCEFDHTTDEAPAKVIFQNRFSAIDESMQDKLKELFNDYFDDMFKFSTSLSLNADYTYEELELLLGKRNMEALKKVATIKTSIKTQENFLQKRHLLRNLLPQETNELIDTLVDKLQAKPQVKL